MAEAGTPGPTRGLVKIEIKELHRVTDELRDELAHERDRRRDISNIVKDNLNELTHGRANYRAVFA